MTAIEIPFNTEVATVVDKCITDTMENTKFGTKLRENQVSLLGIRSWWSNNLIGRDKTPGESVSTTAKFVWSLIVVIKDGDDEMFRIYHDSIYSFTVEEPTDKFWECVQDFDLPGAGIAYKQ